MACYMIVEHRSINWSLSHCNFCLTIFFYMPWQQNLLQLGAVSKISYHGNSYTLFTANLR